MELAYARDTYVSLLVRISNTGVGTRGMLKSNTFVHLQHTQKLIFLHIPPAITKANSSCMTLNEYLGRKKIATLVSPPQTFCMD